MEKEREFLRFFSLSFNMAEIKDGKWQGNLYFLGAMYLVEEQLPSNVYMKVTKLL